jgi:hypothetical protein
MLKTPNSLKEPGELISFPEDERAILGRAGKNVKSDCAPTVFRSSEHIRGKVDH